jgi:hypothetical protein
MQNAQRLLTGLEKRFGRFAIPGLVSAIAGLQLLVQILAAMMPEEAQQVYRQLLSHDPALIASGQVWRLLSYLFMPSGGSVLLALIVALFSHWLGRGLEQAWGAFRLNLYVLAGVLTAGLGGMIFGHPVWPGLLMTSLLLAFAAEYPDEQILLFFIIPLKLRWLAWLEVLGIALAAVALPSIALAGLMGCLNFIVVFLPRWVAARDQRQRRERWIEQHAPSSAQDEAASFHCCARCGRSEREAPSLEFRVNAQGDEICSECRGSAQTSQSP